MKLSVLLWILCCLYLLLNTFGIRGETTPRSRTNQHAKGEKRHQCGVEGCNKSYARARDLGYHQNTHTGTKPYQCTHEGCNESFSYPKSLSRHKESHKANNPGAPYYYSERSKNRESPLIHYNVPQDVPGTSHSSGRIQTPEVEHTNIHGQNFHGTADHHLDTIREKRHQCGVEGCNKSYARTVDLKHHQNIHTGSKPYQCTHEGCNKGYPYPQSLYKHMQSHKANNPGKQNYYSEPSTSRESSLIHNVPQNVPGTFHSRGRIQTPEVEHTNIHGQNFHGTADHHLDTINSAKSCFSVEPSAARKFLVKTDVPKVVPGTSNAKESNQVIRELNVTNPRVEKLADACVDKINQREKKNFRVKHIQNASVVYTNISGSLSIDYHFNVFVLNQGYFNQKLESCCLRVKSVENPANVTLKYDYHFHD